MKIIKNAAVFLLACLMLTGTLMSCKTEQGGEESESASHSSDVQESASATEKETNKWGDEVIKTEIPDSLDYNGATVNVVVREGEAYGREWTTEKTDDSVDMVVFKRNKKVQESLGIKFNFIRIADNVQKAGGTKHMSDALEKVAQAGGKEYDIVNQYRNDAGYTSLLPYYKNVRGSEFTYLNLDNPYWSRNFNEVLETNGKQFFFCGDINLSLWDRAIVVFFNKDKLEYAQVTEAELYKMVIDKKWTYETFYNMIKDIHEEGDTVAGTSAGDFVGLASIYESEASDGLLYSWNVALSQTSIDGYHSIVTDSGYTKYITAGQMIIDLYSASGAWLNMGSDNNIRHFTQGYSLFNIDVIYHGATHLTALKDMEGDYGILPTPMYDETQGEYYTGVQDAHSIMCVMDGDKDFEMISATLEMLAYESYNEVRPYYVKTIIKSQNFDDATSGEMFDIIMEGVTLDYVDLWEGSDPKARWQLWRKPFQFTMGQKIGKNYQAISFSVAYEESVNGLNEKLNDRDLFVDMLE